MEELKRFGVSIDEKLLEKFDHYINTTPEDTIDTIKNKLISFNLCSITH